MYFLRHKKLNRDRGAGLVFRWRGARRHHTGKVVAMLLTIGLFAFSAYALRVEGLRAPLLTQRQGEVVILDEENPFCQKLMFQIEDSSPFPVRWDPAFDPDTMGRLGEATALLEGGVWDYQPELMAMPEPQTTVGLPSIFEGRGDFFSNTGRQWRDLSDDSMKTSSGIGEAVRVTALIIADKEMRDLLPEAGLPLPAGLIGDEWFGQSFRFLIGVDSKGVVRGCLPLSGGSMEVAKPTEKQKLLAAWLRRSNFNPSERESRTIGVLEIQMEARTE